MEEWRHRGLTRDEASRLFRKHSFSQLHLTGAAYIQYPDHSRFECLQAAGISVTSMLRDGFGPVNLETVIRCHKELRAEDEVDVSCDWKWGPDKTYRVEHVFRRMDEPGLVKVNRWRTGAAEAAATGGAWVYGGVAVG